MENYLFGAYGQDNQDAIFNNNSPFPAGSDYNSLSDGDIYGTAEFSDVDFERMSDHEYFNYLRSQDDMI